MKTILAIVGARPQFMKHAALAGLLRAHFRLRTLHTGQHYDAAMSDNLFEELHLAPPDYQLNAGSASTQAEQTGTMMSGIERVCSELRPDALLLYGDTNSTLAGALVAAKAAIPIIHAEAGIRSYNRAMPEEVNRIIADTFSSMLLCPTSAAVENLEREGISHDGVQLSGDLMCDMLERARPKLRRLMAPPYYFATIHRPYNTDDPERLATILHSLNGLAHPVMLPLHPRTATRMLRAGLDASFYANIRFTAPVGYLASLSYQQGAECIITDSGSVQREAYMLRSKCITLRSETEWEETLINGWNTLVFEKPGSIRQLVGQKPGAYTPRLFGDGMAAKRMVAQIAAHFYGISAVVT